MKASFLKIFFDSGRPFHCEYLDLPHFDHPWHFHPELELTLILESDGIRYVGDHTGRFKEGDLVLVGSGLPHLWQNEKTHIEDAHKRSRAIVLQFPEELLAGDFQNSLELKGLRTLFQQATMGILFSDNVSSQLTPLLLEINTKKGLRKWVAVFDLLCTLSEIDDYELLASSGYCPRLTSRDSAIMNKVFEHIRNNYEKKITLQEMADIAYLSRPAFCRYFKKKTSKSFFTFLNEYRIGHSKKMLQQEVLQPVGSIALQSGFPSIQHFNAKFKELEGVTPSQFRKFGYKLLSDKIPRILM